MDLRCLISRLNLVKNKTPLAIFGKNRFMYGMGFGCVAEESYNIICILAKIRCTSCLTNIAFAGQCQTLLV